MEILGSDPALLIALTLMPAYKMHTDGRASKRVPGQAATADENKLVVLRMHAAIWRNATSLDSKQLLRIPLLSLYETVAREKIQESFRLHNLIQT